jgi:hydrogenase expression/formation protein HypC
LSAVDRLTAEPRAAALVGRGIQGVHSTIIAGERRSKDRGSALGQALVAARQAALQHSRPWDDAMCLAVPGRVEQIYEDHDTRMGKVNFGGVVKDVCLACLPDIAVGDYAIVHVGFAISQIDEAAAQATLRTFEALGLMEEELAELRASGDASSAKAGDADLED